MINSISDVNNMTAFSHIYVCWAELQHFTKANILVPIFLYLLLVVCFRYTFFSSPGNHSHSYWVNHLSRTQPFVQRDIQQRFNQALIHIYIPSGIQPPRHSISCITYQAIIRYLFRKKKSHSQIFNFKSGHLVTFGQIEQFNMSWDIEPYVKKIHQM